MEHKMVKRQVPKQLVYGISSMFVLLPLISLVPLLLVSITFLGGIVTDPMALLAIGGLSIGAFLISSLFVFLVRYRETRHIHRIYEEPWAIWAKYDSSEEQYGIVEKDHLKQSEASHFEVAPLILVGIVVLVIGGFAWANNVEPMIYLGLGAFFLFVFLIVMGRWLYSKWQLRTQLKRRTTSSVPAIVISRHGVYDEVMGLYLLKRLRSATYKAPSKRKPAEIIFQVAPHWLELLIMSSNHHANNYPTEQRINILIPPGHEQEAQSIVAKFEADVLQM